MALTVEEWIDGYRHAWETRDPDAAAALFTDDATYTDQPYGEPYRGRDGVRTYWAAVTATQADIRFRSGTPVVSGSRAAVEWWVTMTNGGTPVTLAGEFFLHFDADGLCTVLREYWHFEAAHYEPQEGWGE